MEYCVGSCSDVLEGIKIDFSDMKTFLAILIIVIINCDYDLINYTMLTFSHPISS